MHRRAHGRERVADTLAFDALALGTPRSDDCRIRVRQ
jgi:hypothetical protein